MSVSPAAPVPLVLQLTDRPFCVYYCGCFAPPPQEGKYMRKMRAQDLWFAILDAQTETGNPYMMFKVRGGVPCCRT